MSYYGREILRHGRVVVFKDQVIGISYTRANPLQSIKGMTTLHLASGGEINIDVDDAEAEALVWMRLTELDQ